MNLNHSIDLLLYGAMLIGFSAFAHYQVPDIVGPTPIAAMIGGVLSVFWGVLGLLGFRGRAGAITTLVVLAIVLPALAVNAWLAFGTGVATSKLVAPILTVLLVFTVGQVANLIRADHRAPPKSETSPPGISSERDPRHRFDK